MQDETRSFLTALFGEKPDNSHVLIWTLPDKKSYWHDNIEQAIKTAETYTGKKDVYVGVALSPQERGSNQRGLADETAGIIGLWVDIDIEAPEHKKANLPPDAEAARSLLRQMGLAPTIVIHSGHGLQAWWVFREPWMFDTAEERKEAAKLAERWTNTLKARAKTRNWDVDSTFDLARVMRVAGTTNMKNKAKPMPVKILEHNDALRYDPSEFEEYILQDATATSKNVRQQMDEAGPLELRPDAVPNFEKWELLREVEPKVLMTWDRTRKDFQDQSPSTYDLSLATYAAMVGWSDQEITDLVIASRRKHGDDLKLRQDYYQRTIAKAREAVRKMHAQEAIEELSTGSENGNGYQPPTPDRKAAIIKHLSATFDIPIVRIVKYIADQPTYRLETKVGNIMLGEIDSLIGQTALRKKVAAACGRYIPKFKAERWDKIAQVLLDACEEQTLGEEATEAGQAKAWLQGYLEERHPTPDPQEAVVTKHPFYKDSVTYIFGSSMKQWLAISQGERVSNKQMGSTLRAFGCEPETMYFQIDGKETTRSVWRTPIKSDEEATTE